MVVLWFPLQLDYLDNLVTVLYFSHLVVFIISLHVDGMHC